MVMERSRDKEWLIALKWLIGSFLAIIMLFGCLTLVIVLMITSDDERFPTEGVWYCEENGMQLSFEEDVDSYVTKDGEQVPCSIGIERGSRSIFVDIQDEESGLFEVPFFEGQQVALSPSILAIRGEDGTYYVFVRQSGTEDGADGPLS
ncbi:MAG: hypothetical protein IJW45_01025 [Oscillospiraceae bacterium]|nr:hypothetical protein [Oscillospiraceae bacterium]